MGADLHANGMLVFVPLILMMVPLSRLELGYDVLPSEVPFAKVPLMSVLFTIVPPVIVPLMMTEVPLILYSTAWYPWPAIAATGAAAEPLQTAPDAARA